MLTGGEVAVPVLDGQLVLELGDAFTPPAPRFDVVLVVCHLCSGHHPVERCRQRAICTVCSGAHDATVHLLDVHYAVDWWQQTVDHVQPHQLALEGVA